jgi:hypothetical protein
MITRWAIAASGLGGMAASGVTGSFYIWPHLESLPVVSALTTLVVAHHACRVGTVALLAPPFGESQPPLLPRPAAYGELITAVLAVVATLTLFSRPAWAGPAVWVFNVCGTASLLYAASNHSIRTVRSGSCSWDTALLVQTAIALFATHGLIFLVLMRGTRIGA